MNIILSMPSDGQSNSYIINALQDLGHEVFYIDHRSYFDLAHKVIPSILESMNIDLMLVLYLVPGETYDVDFIKYLKSHFPQTTYASWIFDATIGGEYCDKNKEFLKIIKEYDYFFTVCRGQVQSFLDQKVNASFLGEGFSPYTYKFDLIRKIYDVSFIGQIGQPNVHSDRIKLLKKITKKYSNTIIYGPFFGQDKEILSYHKKRPTYNDIEHSKVVAKSKINIGHSGWTEIDGYFSARNYRIMGSGGFLLANRSKNIEEFFEEDKEIVLYNSDEECIDKIRYYLKNDTKRNKIAIAGYQRVMKDYTFNIRIQELFEKIGIKN